MSFLDEKRLVSARLWLCIAGAAPALHNIAAQSPLAAAFSAGGQTGACAFNSSDGAEVLPLANPGTALAGWRCFAIASLAALKNVVRRGVRVDDHGHTYGKPAYFTAHSHHSQNYAPYIEVQYEDEFTKPTCQGLSPAATVVDADAPVTFQWGYQQSVNAPQSHATLRLRSPGGSWHTLLDKHPTAAQSHTFDGLPLRGECQWHVQVFCAGGAVASDYSAPQGFVCTGSPPAPAITGVDGAPRCTVTWQQPGQTGYELFLEKDGGTVWHSGQRLSADKTVTAPPLLGDGTYRLRLRTLNAQGRWSPFATAQTAVQNQPSGRIAATCRTTAAGLALDWTATGAFDGFVLLCNGGEIARLPADARRYLHRQALGACRYVVQGLCGRHYTPSEPVTGHFAVQHAAVGSARQGDFIPLELRYDAPPLHRQTRRAQAQLVQYEGGGAPVAYTAPAQQRTHRLHFTLPDAAHYQQLLALVGRPVIYKDCQGECFTGLMRAVEADCANGYDAAITIDEAAPEVPHENA